MPRLLSVNVGLPRDVTWNGKLSEPQSKSALGQRMVRKLDIDGDARSPVTASSAPFLFIRWTPITGNAFSDMLTSSQAVLENFTVEEL
jgi:hypothetical protein